MKASPMEGIVDFTGPVGGNAGQFTLPPDFDQKLLAAHWVQVGNAVEQAQQVQPILGTNKGAVGYEVWKYPAKHKLAGKPHKTSTSKAEWILMFRPRTVQNNVNAIYGNVSKRHLVRQQTTTTPVAPGATRDEGVLPHSVIAQRYGGVRDFGDDYEMNVPQNPETSSPQVAAEPVSTGSLPE